MIKTNVFRLLDNFQHLHYILSSVWPWQIRHQLLPERKQGEEEGMKCDIADSFIWKRTSVFSANWMEDSRMKCPWQQENQMQSVGQIGFFFFKDDFHRMHVAYLRGSASIFLNLSAFSTGTWKINCGHMSVQNRMECLLSTRYLATDTLQIEQPKQKTVLGRHILHVAQSANSVNYD